MSAGESSFRIACVMLFSIHVPCQFPLERIEPIPECESRNCEMRVCVQPRITNPVVRPQLLVDVMEVVAERLRTDLQSFGDSGRVVTGSKHPQNLEFLRG